MEQPEVVRRTPGVWLWIVGALVVIAIFVIVFAALGRTRGPSNDTLPGAKLPAASSTAVRAGG